MQVLGNIVFDFETNTHTLSHIRPMPTPSNTETSSTKYNIFLMFLSDAVEYASNFSISLSDAI